MRLTYHERERKRGKKLTRKVEKGRKEKEAQVGRGVLGIKTTPKIPLLLAFNIFTAMEVKQNIVFWKGQTDG